MNALGNKKTIAQNLQYYMTLNGKTRNDICVELGFPYTTVTDWLKEEKYPRIDRIEMLANYFGITKADLIEEKSEKPATFKSDELSGLDIRLIQMLPKMTQEDKIMFLAQINAVLDSRGK